MAIALEFIDFVVPIATIVQKYPGGLDQCLADHSSLIGYRVWYDEHLFRDGAMSQAGIGCLLAEWTELGFVPTETVRGGLRWKDVCVVETLLGGATLPCDWLAVDLADRVGYL